MARRYNEIKGLAQFAAKRIVENVLESGGIDHPQMLRYIWIARKGMNGKHNIPEKSLEETISFCYNGI